MRQLENCIKQAVKPQARTQDVEEIQESLNKEYIDESDETAENKLTGLLLCIFLGTIFLNAGDLLIEIHRVKGVQISKTLSVAIEVDRYGMFYKALQTREIESIKPEWNDHFVIDLQSRYYTFF